MIEQPRFAHQHCETTAFIVKFRVNVKASPTTSHALRKNLGKFSFFSQNNYATIITNYIRIAIV